MPDTSQIPVIDLFAGPGGLGEGFASLELPDGTRPFRLAISIEMEQWAHSTLRFRAFMRALGRPLNADDWRLVASSQAGLEQFMERNPAARQLADQEALRRKLGPERPGPKIRQLIRKALWKRRWIACSIGGPPLPGLFPSWAARETVGGPGYWSKSDHNQPSSWKIFKFGGK